MEFARGQLAGTPLCMKQYCRLFTSYRYPGLKTDALGVRTNAASEHIIVACKNQVFGMRANFSSEEALHFWSNKWEVGSAARFLTSINRRHWRARPLRTYRPLTQLQAIPSVAL